MRDRIEGYNDATCGMECRSENEGYLSGYHEGLEIMVKWALENLAEFEKEHSSETLVGKSE